MCANAASTALEMAKRAREGTTGLHQRMRYLLKVNLKFKAIERSTHRATVGMGLRPGEFNSRIAEANGSFRSGIMPGKVPTRTLSPQSRSPVKDGLLI